MNHHADDVPDELPPPSAEDAATAERWSGRFEQHLLRGLALQHLRERAQVGLAETPAWMLAGFGTLLAKSLPPHGPELSTIAEWAGVPDVTLAEVALGHVTALEVAPDAMVALARTLGLDWELFRELVERDVARRVTPAMEAGTSLYDDALLTYLREGLAEAWEHAESLGGDAPT